MSFVNGPCGPSHAAAAAVAAVAADQAAEGGGQPEALKRRGGQPEALERRGGALWWARARSSGLSRRRRERVTRRRGRARLGAIGAHLGAIGAHLGAHASAHLLDLGLLLAHARALLREAPRLT